MEEIVMERNNLFEIPEYDLPEGYYIRAYQPGDEEHWYTIHLNADRHNKISHELFREQFGNDEELLRERQYYLCYQDEVIGTASAWFDEGYKEGEYGMVHWVAVISAFQGRGLAHPLLSKVLKRFIELGYDKSFLITSINRPDAIHIYKKFGFHIVKMY